jgi:hypothetical protein
MLREEIEVYELHIIVEPDDPSTGKGLDVLLGDVAGLVVEQAVRVTAPGNATHVHSEEKVSFKSFTYSYCGSLHDSSLQSLD